MTLGGDRRSGGSAGGQCVGHRGGVCEHCDASLDRGGDKEGCDGRAYLQLPQMLLQASACALRDSRSTIS